MRRMALALAGTLISLFAMSPVHAHAELTSFELDVTGTGDVVRLTFSEPVETLGTTVVVLDPNGVAVHDGSPRVDGMEVSITLVPLTVAGDYHVNYRVLSDDGHVINGSSRFTVTEAGLQAEGATKAVSTAYPVLTPSPETSAVTANDATVAYWITGLLMLFGVLAAVAAWRAKR